MSEGKTIPLKVDITIHIEQLDMVGIDPWYVNGEPCRSRVEVIKRMTALVTEPSKTRTFLSMAEGWAKVLEWVEPFTQADVEALDGFGPDKAGKLIDRMLAALEIGGASGKVGDPASYIVKKTINRD